MESVSSTTTVEDQPAVSTLSLFPTPVAAPPQAAASLCCFNDVQQLPLLALPDHQQITITLFSEPQDTTALSLFPSARIKDYLPTKNSNPRDLGVYEDLFDAASSLSLSLPAKRKRLIIIGPTPKKSENSSLSTIQVEERVAKKQKVDKTPTRELAVGNHWIHKQLSTSDVNLSSRLLLPKEEITKYVLPLMDMESCRACQNSVGLRVKIRDLDTEPEHELSLKQWKTGSFLLTTNWNTEFVKRRSLQEGDSISMCWDFENLRFLFHKFNAHPILE